MMKYECMDAVGHTNLTVTGPGAHILETHQRDLSALTQFRI
jgi:hypothetical protein